MRDPRPEPPAATRDHYAVLGVSADADARTVRSAYLERMREAHPDLHPGDERADESARRVNLAYAVLRQPERRQAYDRQVRATTTAHRSHLDPLVSGQVELPTDPSGVARSLATAAQRGEARRARSAAYRRAFNRACLRVAVALCAIGLLLVVTTQ